MTTLLATEADAELRNKTYIAVVGCAHGVLDKIYQKVKEIEESRKIKVSLLICCGDFQSVRNATDLDCMHLPSHTRRELEEEPNTPRNLYDFHRYYSGEKTAPIMTVFIGGNHEASNFLQELPYGGWVAPNIYYLGYTGVINFGSLRIAGISGIYKQRSDDYPKGRTEYVPYLGGEVNSVYHYRSLDVFRLLQIGTPLDIIVSHDWPKNIHKYGTASDRNKLYQDNPKFRRDIDANNLGSGPLREMLEALKPKYWLAGHMHVKYEALVNHNPEPDNHDGSSKICTKFLGADRTLPEQDPEHKFLQEDAKVEIIDFPKADSDLKLTFDPEWLAILKATNDLGSTQAGPNSHIILMISRFMLGKIVGLTEFGKTFTPAKAEIDRINTLFDGDLNIEKLQTFSQTASPYSNGQEHREYIPPRAVLLENPQTTAFIQKMELIDPAKQSSRDNIKTAANIKADDDRKREASEERQNERKRKAENELGTHYSQSVKRTRT